MHIKECAAGVMVIRAEAATAAERLILAAAARRLVAGCRAMVFFTANASAFSHVERQCGRRCILSQEPPSPLCGQVAMFNYA